jgi:hypothetical protein
MFLVILHVVRSGKYTSGSAGQTGPKIKWKTSIAPRLTGLAVGPDGTVYASGDAIYAVSGAGKLLWNHPVPGGTHAAPAVGPEGIIYLTTAFGSVQSLNTDGSLRWDSKYPSIAFWSPPALGPDGAVYVTNYVSDLYAFKPDAADARLWTVMTDRGASLSLPVPVLPGAAGVGQPPNMAPPAIGADGNLYVARQHWLHSISVDGKERWTTSLTDGLLGAVAIGPDGTVYVGNQRNATGVFAVNSDGSKRWTSDLPGIVRGSPVVDAQGNIYFGLDTGLTALDPGGSVKWEIKGPASPPALAQDGTIYAILVSNNVPYLTAVDGNGGRKWQWKALLSIGGPVLGPDGTIYLISEDGIVALQDSGSPPMNSSWPQYQHDAQNTGQTR